MKESVLKKAAAFRGINELTLRGEIVIFGSTYMANFPFYELINKSRLECAVYNRSIAEMTLKEAREVLEDCVLAIKPGKIFLSLGEEDLQSRDATEDYADIVRTVRRELPDAELFLITVPASGAKADALNACILRLCDGKHIRAIRFTPRRCTDAARYRSQFLELCCFFRPQPIAFSDVFAAASL